MPYIKQEKREEFKQAGENGHNPVTKNAGELNYELTLKVIKYLNAHGISYQSFNDCIGALEGAKLELYRRMVGRYEDIKIKENGDVYPL